MSATTVAVGDSIRVEGDPSYGKVTKVNRVTVVAEWDGVEYDVAKSAIEHVRRVRRRETVDVHATCTESYCNHCDNSQMYCTCGKACSGPARKAAAAIAAVQEPFLTSRYQVTPGEFVEDAQGRLYYVSGWGRKYLQVVREDGRPFRGAPGIFRKTSRTFQVKQGPTVALGSVVEWKGSRIATDKWVVIAMRSTGLTLAPLNGGPAFGKHAAYRYTGISPTHVTTVTV